MARSTLTFKEGNYMLTILQPTTSGTTDGIYTIIGLIKENRDDVLSIIKLEKPEGRETISCSFVVVLREKNTLGQIVAFLNSWGTNFGPEAGGSGIAGYCSMMSFIEDSGLDIYFHEVKWADLEPDLQGKLKSKSQVDRLSAWNSIILDRLGDIQQLFPMFEHPINANWKAQLIKCKG
jgi:hypothetical protein